MATRSSAPPGMQASGISARDATCLVFLTLYPELTKELGLDSGDLGSEGHMKLVFLKASKAYLLHNKGDNVKLGRWYSYVAKAKVWRESRLPILLVLLAYGMQKGWWKHISETPLSAQGTWRQASRNLQ